MRNQKSATVSTIIRVMDYDSSNGSAIDFITSSQKEQVVNELCEGFLEGEIEMSDEGKAKYFSDRKELRKYVVGLVNNWLRKAPELNGGSGFTYTPKNPGSRQGNGDETLRALKALLKITVDPDAKAEIQAAMNIRLSEIKPKVEINTDALPAHLRHLVGG